MPGSYTFVVVPDTQRYTDTPANNDEFNAMMDWIVSSKSDRNIQIMLHEGDITNNNNVNDWTVAKGAISRLDEESSYVLAQGNHDVSTGSQARTTLMNDFFSLSDNSLNGVIGINTVQFQPGEMQNTYSTLTAPDGRKFLVINLEYGPRQQVVDWANGIASDPQYADHTAIFLTHAYMEEGPADATGEPTPLRSNWDVFGSSRSFNPNGSGLSADTNDGQELWDGLIRKSTNNFKLVLNGHYLDDSDSNTPENGPATTAMQVDRADDGELVYQIVTNFQQQNNGGNGFMRLMEFLPDGRTIQFKTYSPTLDLWLTDPRNQFTIDLEATAADVGLPTDPVIGFTATGTVTGGDNYRGAMSLESVTTVEGTFNNLQFASQVTLSGSGLEEFVGKDLGAMANEDTLTDTNLTTGVTGATRITAMFDGILADTNGKDVSNIFLFDTSPDSLVDVMLLEALDENGSKIGVSLVLTDQWGDTQFDADSYFPAPGTSPAFEENMVGLGIDIAAFGIPQLSGIRITLDGSSQINTIAANADKLGDLNQDGAVTVLDWPIFVQNSLVDLSGFTPFEAFLRGDMDGDLDNDLRDFLQFKKVFDMENGTGAFAAMLARIPEPGNCLLLGVGLIGLLATRTRRRGTNTAIAGSALHKCRKPVEKQCCKISKPNFLLIGAILSSLAVAPSTPIFGQVNFSSFTVENYPPTSGFPVMGAWNVGNPTTAAQVTNNASASVFYGPEDILGERIIGTLNPGGDDDILGFVLGFNPGDTSNTSADYLLLDWKGQDQSFDFNDASGGGPFHNLTGNTFRPASLRLSRVSGTPTADELWSNLDLPQNSSGGVTQLGTAATLSSTGYPTNTNVVFDILYTPSRVVVTVDGIQQFDVSGSFGSGRLGLYSAWMGNPNLPVFSNFQIGDPDETLKAIVNRTTGEINLLNNSPDPLEFDVYELTSEGNSLNPSGWNSLDNQSLDALGDGSGQSWDESAGSNPSALMELFLLGSTNLAPDATVSLGLAYDVNVDAQDIHLNFRELPIDGTSFGIVEYITLPPSELNGDYNNNNFVDAADYTEWRDNLGAPAGTLPNDVDGGIIGPAQYATWKANFGNTATSSSESTAVPELASARLAMFSSFLACLCWRPTGK